MLLVKKWIYQTLKKVTKTAPNMKLVNTSTNNTTDLLVDWPIYRIILLWLVTVTNSLYSLKWQYKHRTNMAVDCIKNKNDWAIQFYSNTTMQ